MDIIQEAISFYKTHRQQFIKDHQGMHLVISGNAVMGVYKTNSEARDAAQASLITGTYIIEHPLLLKRH